MSAPTLRHSHLIAAAAARTRRQLPFPDSREKPLRIVGPFSDNFTCLLTMCIRKKAGASDYGDDRVNEGASEGGVGRVYR